MSIHLPWVVLCMLSLAIIRSSSESNVNLFFFFFIFFLLKWNTKSQCMAKFNDILSERVNWQPNERTKEQVNHAHRMTDITEAIISVIRIYIYTYMYEYRKMQQCRFYTRIGDYIIFIENTFICSINSWRLRSIYISLEHSITNIVWYCWCAHRSTISFLPYLRIQIFTRI